MHQGTLAFDDSKTVAEPSASVPSIPPDFDGKTYDRCEDQARLTGQLAEVYELMSDGQWWTIRELLDRIGKGTETGVSARIRDLRKSRFGSFTIESQRVGQGLWQYRLAKK